MSVAIHPCSLCAPLTGSLRLQVGQAYVSPSKLFMFSVPQNYLRKQVTPLFNYFKTITNNWSQRPGKLMDQ